jgi:hypothetical protein
MKTGSERLGLAWDALSDASDWSEYATACQALTRECVTAGIAIWGDSVARLAQSQQEFGAALSGACRGYLAAWETPWWVPQYGAAALDEGDRSAADAAKPAGRAH